ncbi:MAG: bifunctional diaminohydroxyphosphoribosylaminopyrimidine deaminase/5-amino-6-(5-phosphoribosylamino)uracil reductase RibD, partial [Pseudomonadota bacterium]
GRRQMGAVAPWPAVGCVIVRDGRVVGRGVSDAVVVRHAEVAALTQAGEAARGATVYVTLEPCAHQGRTPPCADALVRAGVARVVSALEDPNPIVRGKGHGRLAAAGVQVDIGLMEAEARADHAGFLSTIERGRPWLTLKLAATLDGRIATSSGESRWITGPEARRRVHLMRARADAVLVGAATARVDDPMLDVRLPGKWFQPVRVVADSGLSLPLGGRLAGSAKTQPLWVLHGGAAPSERREALAEIGALPLEVPETGGGLDLKAGLETLAKRGITRVLSEGGGGLTASLLAAGLVDEIALFTAGKALGGDGLAAVRGFGLSALAEAPAFDLASVQELGGDTLSLWRKR